MNRFKRTGLLAYASAAVILLALVAWPSAAGAEGLGCVAVDKDAIKQLFVRWNAALQMPNPDHPTPDAVVKLYATDAVLLPTVETGPYIGPGPIAGYYDHFLMKKPSGAIDEAKRTIHIGCNVAFDAGLYTFTYRNGDDPTKARYTYVYKYDGSGWLIAHHHSSVWPPEPRR